VPGGLTMNIEEIVYCILIVILICSFVFMCILAYDSVSFEWKYGTKQKAVCEIIGVCVIVFIIVSIYFVMEVLQ
jgi:hypothetical protein